MRGSTTWFDFARRIVELVRLPNTPILTPISTQEYAARAHGGIFGARLLKTGKNLWGSDGTMGLCAAKLLSGLRLRPSRRGDGHAGVFLPAYPQEMSVP